MRRPRAALTGIGLLCRIVFVQPNEAPAYTFKYSAWNSPDLRSMMDGEGFEQIYDEMAVKAFSKLGRKFLADFVPGLASASKPAP
jgi:hypothetical protein